MDKIEEAENSKLEDSIKQDGRGKFKKMDYLKMLSQSIKAESNQNSGSDTPK